MYSTQYTVYHFVFLGIKNIYRVAIKELQKVKAYCIAPNLSVPSGGSADVFHLIRYLF